MDKKTLLSPNLARIMVDLLPQIHDLLQAYPQAKTMIKSDGTPVTELDLEFSKLLEKMSSQNFPDVTIYSEESFSSWAIPLMAIDPLDGTLEYMKGRAEWALSVGLVEKDFKGEGWVYNPVTKELFTSEQKTHPHVDKSIYYGEVSHSEWDKGFYQKYQGHKKFTLKPVGSIAYKLGRLSASKIDFVVSLAPKNIWDIAGGTLLCAQSGIKFYSQGKEVKEVLQTYKPPLIWCREELSSELLSLFS